jgi:hypothetical protein
VKDSIAVEDSSSNSDASRLGGEVSEFGALQPQLAAILGDSLLGVHVFAPFITACWTV